MSRLLLVDDEPAVQLLLAELLGDGTIELLQAANLAEARSLVDANPDLEVALVDKNLPDGTGLDLIRELKQRHPDSEAILMTGYASLDSVIEALEAGAFDYVLKPFQDVNALVVKVRNAREKARLARDRRHLFATLVESEERYRQLFEGATDALIIADRAGALLSANRAALAMFGLAAQHLAERALPEIVIDLEATPARGIRGDGSTFPAEVVSTDLELRGQPVRILSIRDVTERVRNEDRRRSLEAQLRQSQKMEALGRLAGGIAHDYNNLLCVVQNCAGFVATHLQSTEAPPQVLKDVQAIARAGQSAVELSRQLLAFSRTQVLPPEVLDLDGVIEELTPMLQRTLGEQIELVVTRDPRARGCHVLIARGLLDQVVTNLAINARDAMPSGGRLEISTRRLDREGFPAGRAEVLLEVSDSGSGMAPEVVSRIFEPFFTTKGSGKGTGLGLATVFGIVEQAGGTIEVTSAPGQGSTFAVRLPLADRAAPRKTRGARATGAALRGRGETILVAEDDESVRELTVRMLTDAGYRVIAARNAADAVVKFVEKRQQIALLLTDVVMPHMSGPELVARLRSQRPGLPVVYMSGHAAELLADQGASLGELPFLQKPFSDRDLATMLRRQLDAADAAPATTPARRERP